MAHRTDKGITFTHAELEQVLEKAAHEGAKRALEAVGLSDENAGKDIQDVRALIRSYRSVKSAVWKTFLDRLVTFVIMCFLAGLAWKCGLKLDAFK